MKKLTIALVVLVVLPFACAQNSQCKQVHFSGEASQAQAFEKDLGTGLMFRIQPSRFKDSSWAWFVINVIGKDSSPFVFRVSDRNWSLSIVDWDTSFIGAPYADLPAALSYRSRDLLFPTTEKDLKDAQLVVRQYDDAKTSEEKKEIIAELQALHLAHGQFDIQDYRLGGDDPPTSVEWIRFDVKVTLPPDFAGADDLAVTRIECPAVTKDVMRDVHSPDRHRYPLKLSDQSHPNSE